MVSCFWMLQQYLPLAVLKHKICVHKYERFARQLQQYLLLAVLKRELTDCNKHVPIDVATVPTACGIETAC